MCLRVAAEQVWRPLASWFMLSTSKRRQGNTNFCVPAIHFHLSSSIPVLHLRWRVKAGKLKLRWAVWASLPVTLHGSRAVKALANAVKRSSQQMWLKSKDPLWSTHWLKPAHWSDLKWLGAETINNVEVHKWLRVNYMSRLHPVVTQSVTIILWKEEYWKSTEKTASRSSSPNQWILSKKLLKARTS